MNFDFQKYHYKAMNAKTDIEKKAINEELKAFYTTLNEVEKPIFNKQLEDYLISEYSKIASMAGGISKDENVN